MVCAYCTPGESIRSIFVTSTTPDGDGCHINGGQESVPGSVDLLAAKARQVSSHFCVLRLQEIAPRMITKLRCLFRR